MAMLRVLSDIDAFSSAQALFLDDALLSNVTSPTLRIWQNQPCLVLGRFDSRLPHFKQAFKALLQEGVTVLQRRSGGTAVWHGPGVLNVSVLTPTHSAPSGVHEAFEALASGMIKGLKRLGLNADFGTVPNTFCDGPHNLIVSGKKIAGLAQRQRRNGVLVHAVILRDLNLDTMLTELERFYELAGQPVSFDRHNVTTIADQMKHKLSFAEVRDALLTAYVHDHYSTLSTYTESEKKLATQLAETHRLSD